MDEEVIISRALAYIRSLKGEGTKLIVKNQQYTIEEALHHMRFELIDAFTSPIHFGYSPETEGETPNYPLDPNGSTFLHINLSDMGIISAADFPGAGPQDAARFRATGRNLRGRVKLERLLKIIYDTVIRIEYNEND